MVQPVVVPSTLHTLELSAESTAVAMYRTIPLPAKDGAAQLTTAVVLPATACTAVGLPGRPAVGRTRADGALGDELTPAPMEVTVTVYDARFCTPEMRHSVPVVSQKNPPVVVAAR